LVQEIRTIVAAAVVPLLFAVITGAIAQTHSLLIPCSEGIPARPDSLFVACSEAMAETLADSGSHNRPEGSRSGCVSEQLYKLFGAALAEARFDAGRVTDALALVDHALNTGEGPASGLYVPEIHRLRGVFLKSLGSPAEEVERALRTALEIAEEQGAFLLKLRAATSLARLWRDQGNVQQARELLAPIYGWFTEGFDTRDLKEAKTLLEELAS
jgi:hypothetical protein